MGGNRNIKENLMLYASEVSVCGFDEKLYRLKYNPPTKSGDIIDHHVIGYLAPLVFKRIGWGGRYATPL